MLTFDGAGTNVSSRRRVVKWWFVSFTHRPLTPRARTRCLGPGCVRCDRRECFSARAPARRRRLRRRTSRGQGAEAAHREGEHDQADREPSRAGRVNAGPVGSRRISLRLLGEASAGSLTAARSPEHPSNKPKSLPAGIHLGGRGTAPCRVLGSMLTVNSRSCRAHLNSLVFTFRVIPRLVSPSEPP